MKQEDYDVEDYEPKETRLCDENCPHFDEINMCCWQATKKGLCFTVEQYDYCHLGYKEA